MRSRTPIATTKDALMKQNVYSIFDQASGLYSRPYFCQSDAEAIRFFSDIATDAEHPVGKHPADYTLFRLGIFDDTNGNLTDEDNTTLGNALERIASAQNVQTDNLELFDKSIASNGDPRNTLED